MLGLRYVQYVYKPVGRFTVRTAPFPINKLGFQILYIWKVF
jgi:hypothetical protein